MAVKLNYFFKGLVVPAFTPFNDDSSRSINTPIIPQYSDYLKSNNVRGVLVNGTVAEGLTMSVEERKEIAEVWAKSAKRNDQHLIVQVGGGRLTDVKELASHAQSIKANAILCLPDIYYRPSTVENLIDYLAEVGAAAPEIPLLYYHYDEMPKVSSIKLDEFRTSANDRIPTLSGLKFTASINLEEVHRAIRANADDRYIFYYGSNQIIPAVSSLGVRCFMPYSSNLFPKFVQTVLNCCENGDYSSAALHHNTLMRAFYKFSQIGYPIASMKAAMKLVSSIDVGPTRKPLPSFDQQQDVIKHVFSNIDPQLV